LVLAMLNIFISTFHRTASCTEICFRLLFCTNRDTLVLFIPVPQKLCSMVPKSPTSNSPFREILPILCRYMTQPERCFESLDIADLFSLLHQYLKSLRDAVLESSSVRKYVPLDSYVLNSSCFSPFV